MTLYFFCISHQTAGHLHGFLWEFDHETRQLVNFSASSVAECLATCQGRDDCHYVTYDTSVTSNIECLLMAFTVMIGEPIGCRDSYIFDLLNRLKMRRQSSPIARNIESSMLFLRNWDDLMLSVCPVQTKLLHIYVVCTSRVVTLFQIMIIR